MARLFLSHAPADRDVVEVIQGWLRGDGHDVFLDWDMDGIAAGEDWQGRLYERLRWADALVCVVTSAYVESAWCSAEVGVAMARGARILPIVAEAGVVHPLLTSLQHVDMVADRAAARARLLAALVRLDAVGGSGWPDGRSPYPGLRTFDTDLRWAFFGRSPELRDLAFRLRSPAGDPDSTLLVVGPSGCGKSSLVRAGLVPALADDPDWLVLQPITPGASPVSELAREIAVAARPGASWTVADVARRIADGELERIVTELLTLAAPARRLLVVVDQFEELLTRTAAAERSRFIELLRSVSGPAVRVLGTIRPDSLGPLLSTADFPTDIYPLSPLGRAALRQVIEQPAEVAGIEIEAGLVDRLVDDTGSGEALPLLAYTLAQLADGVERGGAITFSRYADLGGVRGALGRQADAALSDAVANLGRSSDAVVADLLRLIELDEQDRPVRRLVRREELPDPVPAEFDAFVARRLLSIDIEFDSIMVGLTHEALFSWPPLADSILRSSSALRARGRIERAAHEWDSANRHRDWLWQGARLSDVVTALDLRIQGGRLQDERRELSPVARQFLQAGIDRRRRWPRLTLRADDPPDTPVPTPASEPQPAAESPTEPELAPEPPPDEPPLGIDPLSEVVSDVESAEDHLGVADDVRAIARMLAALNTRPPLSVALLGNWGSGKSSFMRQVIDWVDALADASKADPRASRYAANVRQVRFNAWHYSDDHLWVGLVEHMFRELADHKRDPNSEAERHDLQSKLAAEEEKLRLLSEGIRSVDAVPAKAGWLGWLLQPLRVVSLLRAVSRDIREEIRSPARLAAGLILILVGVGLVGAFTLIGQPTIGWVAGLVATATGVITPIVAAWRRGDGIAESALATLREKQRTSEEAIRGIEGRLDLIDPARRLRSLLVEISAGDRYERYRGLTGRIQHDLDRLSSDLAAAQEHWAAGAPDAPLPVQRIVLYVDDLDRCTSGRVVEVLQAINLLLSMTLFVVVVAVDPRWLLHALEEHHGSLLGGRRGGRAAEQRTRSLDYLDKIFHIAYAVRPMSEFGSAYLRSLLPPPDPDEPEPATEDVPQPREEHPPSGRPDTPVQTPGPDETLRADGPAPTPLGATGSVLDTGAGDPLLPVVAATPSGPPAGPEQVVPVVDSRDGSPGEGSRDVPGSAARTETGRDTTTTAPDDDHRADLVDELAEFEPDGDGESTAVPIDLTGRELRLWSTEREFLPLLAPLLPTPRAVKKLTNLYRLVRVSVPPDRLPEFIGGRRGGPYQAIALLLAVVVGAPGETRSFLLALSSARADPGLDIVDVLVDLPGSPLAVVLAEHIRAVRKSMPVHGDITTYRVSACRVSRYSFETYQLFRDVYG